LSAAPESARELLEAGRRALRARGGELRVLANADNCVRRRETGEPCADGSADAAALPFVVEVEGLPNLLHELAHVVLLGRLEKDHATEYARIPFDLASAHGRALLFDELACCLVSCDWHPGGAADAQAWFEEQVGIQGHFFGFAERPADFAKAVTREAAAHGADLERAIARARDGLAQLLREGGASAVAVRPRHAAAFGARWRPAAAPPPQ
jgi:hypothetical protein